jgi:hypothetical protein
MLAADNPSLERRTNIVGSLVKRSQKYLDGAVTKIEQPGSALGTE